MNALEDEDYSELALLSELLDLGLSNDINEAPKVLPNNIVDVMRESGNFTRQQWMVLNGAWDSNLDEIEETRKKLGEAIDDILCSAFE